MVTQQRHNKDTCKEKCHHMNMAVERLHLPHKEGGRGPNAEEKW